MTSWRGRRLVRRQLRELAALLDIERGDRLAVDDDDDLLGAGGGCAGIGGGERSAAASSTAACHETVGHHRSVRFLASFSFLSPASCARSW